MTTTQLQLHGLCCGNEASQVERAVSKLAGVEAARVNLASFKITIVHDGPVEPITRTITDLGYGAEPVGAAAPPAAPPTFWAAQGQRLAAAAAGLLLGTGWLLGRGAEDAPFVVALYVLAALAGGFRTFRRGILSLGKANFDMNALMLIGVAGAFAIGAWSEGAMVAFLYAVSNLLEDATTARTRDAIRGLVALAPRVATVRRDGVDLELPIEAVDVDDLVVVRPGERVAVDGVVIEGRSAADQAPITGESMPVAKDAGSEVFAGSINGAGALTVRTTRLAVDSTLAKVIHLVEEAQGARAPVQDFVDRFARWYTPLVLVLAVAIAVIPPLTFGWPWFDWIYRALALIVFACPCALVVSTPVALATGIGNAARRGVLIKGGVHLEQAAQAKVWALDKTGTLTQGRPAVQAVEPQAGVDARELLRLAAAVEARSEHPLAAAILRHVAAEGVAVEAVTGFEALTGRGAKAVVGGQAVYVASPRYVEEAGGLPPGLSEAIATHQEQGRTVVLVGTDAGLLGLVAIADPVRAESRALVAALKREGVARVIMLTGDNARTAAAIAREVGVDEVRADLLPADKVAAVRELEERHGPVAMVGDGINDAPALASAHLGVAMGAAGTDVAIETADVALMGDDVAKLPFLLHLSRATSRVIRQNITFSLGIKLVALVAVLPGWLTLWMAVLGDMGATILVTLNALRLLTVEPPTA
jgi:Cd2+/Zn2+-exporting ATPase